MKKTYNINKMSKKEFDELENFEPTGKFDAVVIIPTKDIHDSGYRCMRFVLTRHDDIVGVVSGWSDVIHINGIGGYGNWTSSLPIDFSKPPKGYGWRIDCLAKSGYVRLFLDKELCIDEWIGSDFQLYVKD